MSSEQIKSVLVAEPVRRGFEHQAFNTSFLLTCIQAFEGASIHFIGESEHLSAVEDVLPDNHPVLFETIRISERRAKGLQRVVDDWKFVDRLIQKVSLQNPDVVVLTSVTKEILWALKIKSLRKNMPTILAVLHAGLSQALTRPKYNFLAREISLRSAMLRASRNVRFLVLEQSILDTAAKKDPELASRLTAFPHPLPPDLIENDQFKDKSLYLDEIRIGLLGLCTPQKGLFRFLKLAKYAKENGADRLRFEIIGRLHHESVDLVKPYLEFLDRRPAGDVLPREDFVNCVANLHFSSFLFEGAHYQVTASGVMLDCIGLGIPVISEPCPLISSLEKKTKGAIGLTDTSDLSHAELVRALTDLTLEQYEFYRYNMLSLRPHRLPKSLSDILLGDISRYSK